ncbi:MAG: GAF domain-containing protein, partial [Mesorhizobium sp.]
QAPIALVTLVDLERQWFKSCFGLDETGTATGISFCAHAIAAGDGPMVVTDATADPRFKNNPLVTGEHHVRFYAGAPM